MIGKSKPKEVEVDADRIFLPRFELPSSLLDYFGLWMIHDATFLSLVQRVQGMNLAVHMSSQEIQQSVEDRDNRLYSVNRDGIATISIRGPMMKAVPSMAEGTSTVRLRQQLKSARRDQEVRGAMLVMDTPGGTAKGNEDLANEVAAFASEKPIYAFVEDMTASAGVSVASQATKRFANNATAIYGSIGTFAVLEDASGMADKLGVKVHVIRAGEYKGMGTPGTEITESHLAEIQRVVNLYNASYLATIARGLRRSVESLQPLADGRAIMASDAAAAGLIDGIQTYEQTYSMLLGAVSSGKTSPAKGTKAMADSNPATLAELKATFPNSTAEWRESQLEAGVSLSAAAISYANHVEKQAAAEREKHKQELEQAAKNAGKPTPSLSLGHRPLTTENVGGDDSRNVSGDPVADFDAAVRARLPKTHQPSRDERNAAIAYVARTNPQLHRDYIIATNAKTGRMTRLIKEKFEGAAAE